MYRCSLKTDISMLFLSMFKKQWGDRVVTHTHTHTHTHTIPHNISSLELGFLLINRTKSDWAFFLRHRLPGERHQRFCSNIKNNYASPHVGFILVWNLRASWYAVSILWLPTLSFDQGVLPTASCTFWTQCLGQYTHVLGMSRQDTTNQAAETTEIYVLFLKKGLTYFWLHGVFVACAIFHCCMQPSLAAVQQA